MPGLQVSMDRIDKISIGIGGSTVILVLVWAQYYMSLLGRNIDGLDVLYAASMGTCVGVVSRMILLKKELDRVNQQLRARQKERMRALGLKKGDRDE